MEKHGTKQPNENSDEYDGIGINDLAIIQDMEKSVILSEQIEQELGENPAKVLLLLLKNPQMSEVEAYKLVYECSDINAYKNFRRVTRNKLFQKALETARIDLDNLIPTKESVLELLWARSKTSILDVIEKDKSGLKLKDLDEISPIQGQMIKSLAIDKQITRDRDNNPVVSEKFKITMHDQMPNLKILSDYLGIGKQTSQEDKQTRINNFILAIQQKIGTREI